MDLVPPDSELMGKTLADSYKLLLELVGDLIPIQEKLNIDGNPILGEALRSNKASTDILFGKILNLFMCLEENIIAIQDKLDIVGYTNQARVEEVDENMRACLRKLKEFHGPLENDPGVIFPKYGEMCVKKIMFTGEGLPLFLKLSSQQLHEIFVKNPSNAGQCPCLEQATSSSDSVSELEDSESEHIGFGDRSLFIIAELYPNLRYLNLWEAEAITDKGLCAIIGSCRKLEHLNISYCKNISDKSLFEIAENCHDLQEFHFAEARRIKDASTLMQRYLNIEYLDFADVMALQNDALIVAIIRASPNLRHLDISYNDIGDEVTKALAHTCHKLEYLNLSSCTFISERKSFSFGWPPRDRQERVYQAEKPYQDMRKIVSKGKIILGKEK
ncbi:hypothetical protein C1646_812418 [Rhizophagus diaphanus]|nr:hypothetical protein C1646_812418 [Rhizophagus diaphanus] [Rhizophagus sp. MUCL 43196]